MGRGKKRKSTYSFKKRINSFKKKNNTIVCFGSFLPPQTQKASVELKNATEIQFKKL